MPSPLPLIVGCAIGLLVSAVSAQHVGTGFDPADRNRDGVVERAEHDAFIQQDFEAADTQRDGKLDAQELAVWLAKNAARNNVTLSASDAKRAGLELLKAMDRDGDGGVSFAEQKREADRSFERLDVNKDGRLVREEMPSLAAPRRPSR